MTVKSNNPFKFWEELKRRKVFRVIAMYAGTSFILLELVDIVAPSLGLPNWTLNFIIILLCVGFPISVILAWIFDITPEGVKKTQSYDQVKRKELSADPVKRKLRVGDVIIVVLIVVVGILVYPKIFKKDKFEDIRDEDGRISVAVMPFENQTGDANLDYFQRGISSLLINSLGLSPGLSVRDDQTMFDYTQDVNLVNIAGISPSQAKEVAKRAHAQTYISGSYQLRQGTYCILANLVDAESGDIIWTNRIDGNLKAGYLDLADSLSNEIKNYLEIRILEKDVDFDFRNAYPKSSEAYRYYIEGLNLIMTSDYQSAIEYLDNALNIDSTFTFAYFYKAFAYTFKVPMDWENMKLWTQKAYNLKKNLPPIYQNWLSLWYTSFFTKDGEEIKRYCNLLEESEIESRLFWLDLGTTYYSFLKDYEKAIKAFEKVEERSIERGSPWKYIDYYMHYGITLHKHGKYEKEKEILELGLSLASDNYWKRDMYYFLASNALSRADTLESKEYLEKYIFIKKEMGQSQDNIYANLGVLYFNADLFAEAADYGQKAIKLNPENIGYKFQLGKTLIEGNINIEEGLVLLDETNNLTPDNHLFLYWKAKAHYNLGNYKEAMFQVEKAIDINQMYFHDAIMLKKEIEQAVAN